MDRWPIHPRRWLSLAALATSLLMTRPALANPDAPDPGGPGVLEPHTASLLVDYYQAFLLDQDLDQFRQKVTARYTEGTLCRLLASGAPKARRAAVLSLGLIGTMQSNAALAGGLMDRDPTVRALAENALWAIWFRADTPQNNRDLERVRELIGRGRLDDADRLATRIIERSPGFAEAYNQRAIIAFHQGNFAASAADCRRTLERNPYHVGALSGLAQCYLRQELNHDALLTLRRALELQPYNEGLRDTIRALEAFGD